jgi:ABC-2 type transport system ATP-binding protein
MDTLDRNDTPPSDTVVELSGVSKTYRQRQRPARLRDVWGSLLRPRSRLIEALRGVSLRIGRGEVVAYAGPNGAGKSTTIKLLAGLLAANAGTVRVLGMDPVRDRARCVGRLGVVFGQRTELWWDHPIAASFEWKRVVWDVPRAQYERTLGFVREVLGLDEFMNSLARELSLGQRMRADLALALLHEPELLLLDEPTLGLDVLAKRNVLRFVKELNRERQLTVVVTSHDMSDLEQLAGRIVMIHQGSIAFDGPFDRLRREFSDRRRLLLETAPVDAVVSAAAGVGVSFDGHPPGVSGRNGAPHLDGAVLLRGEPGRYEYVFDASRVGIASLLEQAAAQARIVDVETHRAPIDDVIADIYERWQQKAVCPVP